MRAEQRQTVWVAFLHAHEAVTRAVADEIEESYDVGFTYFMVLLRLAEHPNSGMRMQDLADLAFLSRSGVTRLVDRMEEAGLVRRQTCADDRRGTFAVITDEGRRLLDEVRPRALRAIDEHFAAHLTSREAAALLSAFRKILRAHASEAGLRACGDC